MIKPVRKPAYQRKVLSSDGIHSRFVIQVVTVMNYLATGTSPSRRQSRPEYASLSGSPVIARIADVIFQAFLQAEFGLICLMQYGKYWFPFFEQLF
jgi:hypothetical protein